MIKINLVVLPAPLLTAVRSRVIAGRSRARPLRAGYTFADCAVRNFAFVVTVKAADWNDSSSAE